METQEEYRVAVSTEPNPTLEELEQLYQDYLTRGREVYADLILVVQMLGAQTNFPRRAEPWTLYDKGEITAIFGEVTTAWSVGRSTWSIRQTLAITIGRPVIDHMRETRVCHLSFQDDQFDPKDKDNIFVPGRWLETMLADLPKAKAIAGAHSSREYKAKRQALAERLLIGKEV